MSSDNEAKKLVPNVPTSSAFKIKTEVFEGPLDLLLSLVEKRKLFINDIALAKVTDDYIRHIEQIDMSTHNPNNKHRLGESAQFILIASTLLLIKSKSLLPNLTLTEDEEGGIHDLEMRLKIYKRIKEAGEHVKALFGKQIIYPQSQIRKEHLSSKQIFSPHESMTLLALAKVIKEIVHSLPKKETMPKAVVRKIVSLEEMIDSLTDRITASLRMSFKEFTAGQTEEQKKERVNIIVSFLAMLELVKQGVINASQDEGSEDIDMETKKIGVPRYN